AVIDEQAGKIMLDLGNALPTTTPGSGMRNLGRLTLAYVGPPSGPTGPNLLDIAPIDYFSAGWYEKSAGLVTLPVGRTLRSDELTAIQHSPLVITAIGVGGKASIAIAEPFNGTYIRADQYVFRLNPGDTAEVNLFASQWGRPYGGARIICVLDPLQ